MTAAYDRVLCERLCAQAKRIDDLASKDWRVGGRGYKVLASPSGIDLLVAETTHGPTSDAIAWMRNNLSAMADQLEAARREVERLTGANGEWAQIAADGLAERDALRDEVERLRDVARVAGIVRNMRLAIDPRIAREDRRVFDDLSEVFDAWKFPNAPPPARADSSSAPHDSPCASPED